ncbi:MAG: NADH-quinone oxidoreductase subunit NuoH [Bacteroidota bacterium]|nr:NADH-quinone oxidoreductase subunit NuoH [Bacteroidota bacterium]MDP4205432.1 NADH-quinone oxidoreductase subunit NuoH [Bacteroidota bacterium]
MDFDTLIFKTILLVVIFLISLVVAMYATYGERKIAAFFQDRFGPNRAGPWGLLQPVADGVKMFMKEEIIPVFANKGLFILGPSIAMFTACMTSAVIPWGGSLELFGKSYSLQVADLNIGILYIFAIVSLGVYGIMIGGWASNNKFSLLGSVRAGSQMISYELAMGLAIVALIMTNNTLSLNEIVVNQKNFHWNIFYQPLGFLIFLTTALAECNRAPFDLAECENELIGGYHTEFSSMKLGFYLFSEYVNMFISSAVISTLYFGGYNIPFGESFGLAPNLLTVLGTVFLFAKIIFFIFVFMWIRWTLPRFRYDQLMRLGWQWLVPLAILNMIITGAVIVFA